MDSGRVRRWWRRRGGTWWWATIVIVLPVAALTAVAIVVLWRVVDLGDPKNRIEAIRLALTVGAGTGGVVALVLAGRRQWSTEHDARERRLTELYIKAVEQLGSSQPAVRHGGLYALERVAQDNPAQRQTVVDVICAYLRSPYTPPPVKPGVRPLGVRVRRPLLPSPARRATPLGAADGHRAATAIPQLTTREDERRQEREVRLTAQRILYRHLKPGDTPKHPVGTFWTNVNLNLTGALLIDFNLTECHVHTATFTDARFSGNAWFEKTQFHGDAWFQKTQFQAPTEFGNAQFLAHASFEKAQFHDHASFEKTQFSRYAWFREAQFHADAGFREAQFHAHAGFREAQFHAHAGFDETQFSGHAWFQEAQFHAHAGFREAQFHGATEFDDVRFEQGVPSELARFLPAAD